MFAEVCIHRASTVPVIHPCVCLIFLSLLRTYALIPSSFTTSLLHSVLSRFVVLSQFRRADTDEASRRLTYVYVCVRRVYVCSCSCVRVATRLSDPSLSLSLSLSLLFSSSRASPFHDFCVLFVVVVVVVA